MREWLSRLWGTLGHGRRDEDLHEELLLHLRSARRWAPGGDESSVAC